MKKILIITISMLTMSFASDATITIANNCTNNIAGLVSGNGSFISPGQSQSYDLYKLVVKDNNKSTYQLIVGLLDNDDELGILSLGITPSSGANYFTIDDIKSAYRSTDYKLSYIIDGKVNIDDIVKYKNLHGALPPFLLHTNYDEKYGLLFTACPANNL